MIAGKLLARQRVLSVIANEEPVECRVLRRQNVGGAKETLAADGEELFRRFAGVGIDAGGFAAINPGAEVAVGWNEILQPRLARESFR